MSALFAVAGVLSAPLVTQKLHYGNHSEYIVYFVLILALDARSPHCAHTALTSDTCK